LKIKENGNMSGVVSKLTYSAHLDREKKNHGGSKSSRRKHILNKSDTCQVDLIFKATTTAVWKREGACQYEESPQTSEKKEKKSVKKAK